MEVDTASLHDDGSRDAAHDVQDQASVTAAYRSSSQQPNEKLLSYVRDFSLAHRQLNVRIYHVFLTTSGTTATSDCAGYRVAATDEGENDYALFISRVKGEQLYKAVFPGRTDPMTGEAVASSILNHLDIVGNRHREVGRMICRDPQVTVSKKERVARPKTPSKQRNAHLPSREEDKRTSRNKQTQQRTHEAIAASHEQPTQVVAEHHDVHVKTETSAYDAVHTTHSHFTAHGEVTEEIPKGRKTSEMSLLHRIANADATTMWRSELGAIGDEAEEEEVLDDDDDEAADEVEDVKTPSRQKASPVQHKRVVPERKTKHKELQQRRDKERNQRLLVAKSIPKSPSKDVASTRQGSPPRLATNSSSPTRQRPSLVDPPPSSQVAASAVIGNAHALKRFVASPPSEQEQFLRRKTILANERRVFKAEGVFDDALDVEITLERPDHRSMEYAPVASPQRRSIAKRRSKVPSQSGQQTLSPSVSASLPPVSEPEKISPRPEQAVASEDAADRSVNEIYGEETAGDHGDGRDGENQSLEGGLGVVNASTPRAEDAERDAADQDNDEEEGLDEVDDRTVDAEEEAETQQEGLTGLGAANHDIHTEELLPMLRLDPHHEDSFAIESPLRSSRQSTGRTIHIVEEEEAEEMRTEPPIRHEEGEKQAETDASPRPEEPPFDQQLTAMTSPRVECWEEAAPQNQPMPEAEQAADEAESSDASWGSAPELQTVAENAGDTERVAEAGAVEIIGKVDDEDATQDHAADTDDPIVEVQPPRTLAETDDPVVEIESLKQTFAVQSKQDDAVGRQVGVVAEVHPEASSIPSTSLKRSEKPNAARRTSIVDVHASAIAAAAAAAAATATVAPQVEEIQPKRSPKSAAKRSKRRSHDGIPTLASPTATRHALESRREKTRRSTLHGLPSMVPLKTPKKQVTDSTGEDVIPDNTASHLLESIEATPLSSAPSETEAETHELQHSDHHSSPSHHEEHSHHHHHQQNHKRSQQETEALQRSPGYHTKWEKWKNGKQLIDKVSCLQLEEKLMEDPDDETTLVKLGVRYARWPATSLAAALLLENASGPQQEGTSNSHEYWYSLGNAHFDVFLRHRKFLPLASFHLGKCMQAFTRTFAYLQSLADPLLLLRYTICLYWKKSDNNANLERADDILREMFVKFAKFCDHDRGNLLFLHFQILCRLKMYGEAIDCLAKITALHNASLQATATEGHTGKDTDSEASTASSKGAPTPYDSNDYLLMLMHCQQASGDFLQSSLTFTQLLKQLHGHGVDASGGIAALEDHDYLHLWGSLADKCFHQEDYALATDFYGLAATYAKDSRVLARMLYNHALCYQAIGEHVKCNAEFKRAKNLNRHVMPFATLAEIHARYDDTYATLLRTPVDWIIEEVRQTLYDRAVSALQRLFRRKKQARGNEAARVGDADKGINRTHSGGARASIDRRRQSIAGLLHAGGRSVMETGSSRSILETDDDTTVVVDSHDEFLKRHAFALKKLEKLRARPAQKSRSFNEPQATVRASGLLSPWKDRPDLRRKHSMDTFAKQLGYVPGGRACYGEYWEQLVATALELYETRKSLDRHIARVRSTLPLVSEAVACCALADALGNVEVALERLHDTTYEHELQLVSGMTDVGKLLSDRFASGETAVPTRFPPIASPAKTSLLPANSSSPSSLNKHQTSASQSLPLCSSPHKTVRLSSLIDAQFSAATAQNRAALQEQEVSASALGKQIHGLDRFAVLNDFRQVNTSLLHGWQR